MESFELSAARPRSAARFDAAQLAMRARILDLLRPAAEPAA